MSDSIYEFTVKNIQGKPVSLRDYANKVLLIVNVASKCGFTKQYEGLEKLQREYGPKGFTVLGFPCNQFGKQEPGDEAEIQNFCKLTYDVSFPLFAKVDVNGAEADPVFAFLKGEKPGFLGTEIIKWNFTKFLVSRQGKVIQRFAPNDEPESLAKDIERLL